MQSTYGAERRVLDFRERLVSTVEWFTQGLFGGLVDKQRIFAVHGCDETVSYTHLDVYKRQIRLRAQEGPH